MKKFSSVAVIVVVYIQLLIATWRAAILIRYGFIDYIFSFFSMQSIVAWLIPAIACAYVVETKNQIPISGILWNSAKIT